MKKHVAFGDYFHIADTKLANTIHIAMPRHYASALHLIHIFPVFMHLNCIKHKITLTLTSHV